MKRFDLKEFQGGAKVVTRDGNEVQDLTYFPSNGNYKLAGVTEGVMQTWTEDGRLYMSGTYAHHPSDLVIEETKKYVNVYQGKPGLVTVAGNFHGLQLGKFTHDSRENAVKTAQWDGNREYYVGTVEYTEE